jgi:HKD family nuclease
MKYIDSGIRDAEQTVGFWMKSAIESKIREFRCQAGYFTLDGSSLLLPLLKKCASEGAVVRLLLGSNGGATLASHIAFLAGALGVPQKNVSLGVISFDNCLFHPKVYHFVREDGSQTAYVGSANLTESGIAGRNVEAGVILDSSGGDDISVLREIEKRIEAWFDGGPIGLSHITKHADIDDLLASGYLALAPKPRAREIEEEGEDAAARPSRPRAALKSIFKLPPIEEEKAEEPEELIPLSGSERLLFVRHTESSFHYPQGTHLGHILAILAHFAGDRAGTAFDNQFIRLEGSLGTGRIAAYRRQVKYKMLAAIELGLITDIRLVDDTVLYEPGLTEVGSKLWTLMQPFVAAADLVLEVDAAGDYSTKMPQQPGFYNEVFRTASEASLELGNLYRSVALNMPAVRQMLKLLYHKERTARVAKARIYEDFFDFEPVRMFCDEMGIEPGTLESARHRCPFLLNIIESCGLATQSAANIHINTLALAPDLLLPEGAGIGLGQKILPQILADWGKESILPASDQKMLRQLFGEAFLTNDYHLKTVLEIPVKDVK